MIVAQFFLFAVNVTFAILTDVEYLGHRGSDDRYVVPPDFHNWMSMANPTAPSVAKFGLFLIPVYHYGQILSNVYKVR